MLTALIEEFPSCGAPVRENGALRRVALSVVMLLMIALATACASDPEPVVEDFPSLLIGTWIQVGGPNGTLRFEGSTASGTAVRSAEGVEAESFTFQWVAPAIIRTNLPGDVEFTVLFEDKGETLVLATVAAASEDQVIRYSRVK